jgi:hypothetical protein
MGNLGERNRIMAEIIASIAALALIGTTFVILGYAAVARDRQMRQVAFQPVVLEFKPRQRKLVNSNRG